jgi:hypothetical protein
MRWKKAGGQGIVNLRVMLLSNVWSEGYRLVMKNINNAYVPAYDICMIRGAGEIPPRQTSESPLTASVVAM